MVYVPIVSPTHLSQSASEPSSRTKANSPGEHAPRRVRARPRVFRVSMVEIASRRKLVAMIEPCASNRDWNSNSTHHWMACDASSVGVTPIEPINELPTAPGKAKRWCGNLSSCVKKRSSASKSTEGQEPWCTTRTSRKTRDSLHEGTLCWRLSPRPSQRQVCRGGAIMQHRWAIETYHDVDRVRLSRSAGNS